MNIEITCAACGNNRFNLSDADEDDSIIVCEECDHITGTSAELKQRVVDEVLKHATA